MINDYPKRNHGITIIVTKTALLGASTWFCLSTEGTSACEQDDGLFNWTALKCRIGYGLKKFLKGTSVVTFYSGGPLKKISLKNFCKTH